MTNKIVTPPAIQRVSGVVGQLMRLFSRGGRELFQDGGHEDEQERDEKRPQRKVHQFTPTQ